MSVNNISRECRRILCIATGLLGLILVGLAVFLLATGSCLVGITVGLFVAGLILLFLGCFGRCLSVKWLLCWLLALIAVFLVIAGILTLLTGAVVIGLILIGLGVLTAILAAICACCHLCCDGDPDDNADGEPCDYH